MTDPSLPRMVGITVAEVERLRRDLAEARGDGTHR